MKRTKNEIVKVWSHRRSGTNFLCGLLYVNFYNGRNMTAVDDHTRVFVSDTGERSFYSKWGKLFGGHDSIPPEKRTKVLCACCDQVSVVKHDPNRWMYIKRNVIDTARSWYNREDFMKRAGIKGVSFDDFISMNVAFDKRGYIRRRVKNSSNAMTIVKYIQNHHNAWEKSGVYTIDYKELVSDYRAVLNDIAYRFGLTFVSGDAIGLDRKVGWGV